MTTGTLDRKKIVLLLGSLLAIVILRYSLSGGGETAVVAPVESIPLAEQRLEKLKQVAATVPGKEATLRKMQAELALREAALLKGATAEQARAHLIDVVQATAAANNFDARGIDSTPQPKLLGKDYGEVSVVKSFTCGIDQLVNFLSTLPNLPELVATSEIQVNGPGDKKKNLRVRVTLSAVVPRKLVPEKKGMPGF